MLSCKDGVGASCPGQFILPPTHLGIKVKYFFSNFTYFKLPEYEDVSIINTIQVNVGPNMNLICYNSKCVP